MAPESPRSASPRDGATLVAGLAAKPHASGGSNNIRVAVRMRPFNSRELSESGNGSGECAFEVVGSSVRIAASNERILSEYTRAGRSFNFDEVYSSTDKNSPRFATQESVFEGLGVPILENALDAYNGCLLAYGQTGAGKSHSVLGDPTCEQEKGLLPRACERLFDIVERRKADAEKVGQPMQVMILASYLEIYQEKMFDLLVSDRSDLHVRLHKDLGPHVPGLTQTPVANMKDVHDLLDFGAKNRAVGATSMNATSSRSHAVFTIDLRIAVCVDGGQKDMQSKVNFVDLAGSEKQKKTGATGERLQEGIAINQSLSALSRVIQALSGSAGKNVQPPFRESKLTLLLKDALSGNSRTVLLACVSPSRFNLEESVSTLEFASRCKLIKTNAKKNEQDKRELIESLTAEKERIARQLEEEAMMKQLLQAELEKEIRNARDHEERAAKIQEEKADIERQLRELEQQRQSENASLEEERVLRQRELESQAQRVMAREQELDRQAQQLKAEHDATAQELTRRLQEKEELEKAQKLKEEEMIRLREEKEREIHAAEIERKAALRELEESKRKQEEEQRVWAAQQEEIARRARELEERLSKQTEADTAERSKLEQEHERVKQALEREREERERKIQEADQIRQERERELTKMTEERAKATEQLQELKRQQAEDKQAMEEFQREKELQAQQLQRLQEQAAQERERRQEFEEQQRRAQAMVEEREKVVSELQEKMRMLEEQRSRHLDDTEERLSKQNEAEAVERSKLEQEHERVKQALELEREELERKIQEADHIRQEREKELSTLSEERAKATEQLQELKRQQAADKQAMEEVQREKDMQAQQLQRLQEQAEEERERRQDTEEQKRRAQAEVEERDRKVAELLEKLKHLEEQQSRHMDDDTEEKAAKRQAMEQQLIKFKTREAELSAQCADVQNLCNNFLLDKEKLERTAQEQRLKREQLLEGLGIKGLQDADDMTLVPRLVNLHPDPSLQGCLVYYLSPGKTQVGSDPQACRVTVSGIDVADQVCAIHNEGNEKVKVFALPNGFVRVNGVKVEESEEGQAMQHGDRLTIGRAHIFSVVIPMAKRALEDNDSEQAFVRAMEELQDKAEVDPKWRRAVDDAVMIVKRDFGTKPASDLLASAKAASENVKIANHYLQNIPEDWRDDVSHYELAVLFVADGPPVVCVVAKAACAGGEDMPEALRASKGIWEASLFEKRLEVMEEANNAFDDIWKRRSASSGNVIDGGGEPSSPSPTIADWTSFAWSEVPVSAYKALVKDREKILTEAEEEERKPKQREDAGWGWPWTAKPAESSEREPPSPRSPGGGTTLVAQEMWAWLARGVGVSWFTQGQGSNDSTGSGKGEAEAAAQRRTKSQQPRGRQAPMKSDLKLNPGKVGMNRTKSATTTRDRGRGEGDGQDRMKQRGLSPNRRDLAGVASGDGATGTAKRISKTSSDTWPAAAICQEELTGDIVVSAPSVDMMKSKTSAGKSAAQKRLAQVMVTHLFNGRLGVRLRMETLVVTGFDDTKATDFGWQLGDVVKEINGCSVSSGQEFRARLEEVKDNLPIVFIVVRERQRRNTIDAIEVAKTFPNLQPAAPTPFQPAAAERAAPLHRLQPSIEHAGGSDVSSGESSSSRRCLSTTDAKGVPNASAAGDFLRLGSTRDTE